MTTLERFDLRLGRTSLQYAIDYGWTTEVIGTRLVFAPSSHVVGVAIPDTEAASIVEHLVAHRLSCPVLRLPEHPGELIFLATTHTLSSAPWPLVQVSLPPSQTDNGAVTWIVPPRRSSRPIPCLATLLGAVRTISR